MGQALDRRGRAVTSGRMRRLAAIGLCLCPIALAGCAGLSVSPSGGTYASPVTISVDAGADIEIGSLRATVDGADRTTAFVYSNPGLQHLYATFTLPPGPHTVQATANVWNSLYRTYDPKSAQASFEAGAPGSLALTISPTAVAVLPGGSATINLAIARGGSFTGDVRIGESDPFYGTGNTTTISVFDTTGTIPVTARADASAGQRQRSISARGTLFNGSVSDDKSLAFRIGHRVGAFNRATYPARTAGQSATGPDNATTLNVENGPPMAPRYEARFRRPTNSIGATVGFEPGVPAVGGAGFCSNGTVGFVMSGGSPSTPHTLTLVMFEDAWSKLPFTIPASVPNGAVVTPEVFFSRDCAVMIMVGADMQMQHAFRAQVYDVHQHRTLCSVAFDAPPATLQAELMAPVADNQELRVTVGGQLTPCNVF